tara:strand:+ start:2849 stop:3130 length:282 start_codon:yes stop_codon:yes gene_type:complete
MTAEQIQKISALGYIVVNMGQYVEDMHKNVVASKDVDGNWVTEVEKIKTILAPTETVKVRARNKKGHYVKDDPSTPENEAWTTKVIKKVTRKA